MNKHLKGLFITPFLILQLIMIFYAFYTGTVDDNVVVYYYYIGIILFIARELLYPPLPQLYSTISQPQYTRETFSIDISIYFYFAFLLLAFIHYHAKLFYPVACITFLVIRGINLWIQYRKIKLVK